MDFYSVIRPLLFALQPETAHKASLNMLNTCQKLGLKSLFPQVPDAPVKVMGIDFPNPVGIASGFDKNAEYIDAVSLLGAGHIELGTVTPQPQPGNARPRLHRLTEHEALINFMGFNNKGINHFLKQFKKRSNRNTVLGISITQNNNTPQERAMEDYLYAFRSVYATADYICIDVSCPNVPNKPSLQMGKDFEKLLDALKQEQLAQQKVFGMYVPFIVKMSPDLTSEEIQSLAKSLINCGVDGVSAVNTSKQRPHVENDPKAKALGGLSGPPLLDLAENVIKQFHSELGDKLPIIGIGGVHDAASAKRLFDAGASLVQVYTGLVYQGPKLISDIVRSLKTS